MAWKKLTAIAGAAVALAISTSGTMAAQTGAELTAAVQKTLATCYETVKTCKEFGNKASGILVFPEVTKAAIGVGGEYGEGALVIHGKPVAFYSTTAASIGLQIGAEQRSQVIMFLTDECTEEVPEQRRLGSRRQCRNHGHRHLQGRVDRRKNDDGSCRRLHLQRERPDGRSLFRGAEDFQDQALGARNGGRRLFCITSGRRDRIRE